MQHVAPVDGDNRMHDLLSDARHCCAGYLESDKFDLPAHRIAARRNAQRGRHACCQRAGPPPAKTLKIFERTDNSPVSTDRETFMASLEGCGLALASSAVERAEVPATIEIEALVATYSTLLFRVAYAVVRNRNEAEDAVQDTFLRVLSHRAKLPEVQDVRVWLVRIAWRLALDRKRHAKPDQMDYHCMESLVARNLPADQAVAEYRELRQVLDEMERLPKGERNVLLLSAVEEMKTVEIAAVLGKSESAVRALIFRARTRLRERLERRNTR